MQDGLHSCHYDGNICRDAFSEGAITFGVATYCAVTSLKDEIVNIKDHSDQINEIRTELEKEFN